MKTVALILAMFVSLLTVKPGWDAMTSQLSAITGSSCCTVSCNAIADDGQGDCSGKSCNVFGTCTSCALQITEARELEVNISKEPALEAPSTYVSAFSFRYVSDCWHPPRFV